MTDESLATAREAARRMFANDRASQHLGIEIDIPEAGRSVATMTVAEDMVNGFDICHGGLVFALADTAFAFACNARGRVTVAAGASIEWLRPARLGDRLTAEACEIQRGRRGGYYDVRVTNQNDKVVALFRGRAVEPSERGTAQ